MPAPAVSAHDPAVSEMDGAHTATAQVSREGGAAVHGKDTLRCGLFDVAQQRREVGVVGERQGGVHTRTGGGAWMERPAREEYGTHGAGRFAGQAGTALPAELTCLLRGQHEHGATPIRRLDRVRRCRGPHCDRAEGAAIAAIDVSVANDRSISGDGETKLLKEVHRLLRLAQRVGCYDGEKTPADPLIQKARQCCFYFGAVRKAIAWLTECTLDHQVVAGAHLRWLSAAAGPELEIAGVDQTPSTGHGHQHLCSTQHVARRKELDPMTFKVERLAER